VPELMCPSLCVRADGWHDTMGVVPPKSPKSTPRRAPKDAVTTEEARPVGSLTAVGKWFDERTAGWFVEPIMVAADRDEVVVTGRIAIPAGVERLSGEDRVPLLLAAIDLFREATRGERVSIASVAEAKLQRHVSWAVRCGDVEQIFTNVSTPIMTRLRFAERQVLDTLVDASIARSRSEALAWCVRLVAQHEADWISELQAALAEVETVRAKGPQA
jgi:hypothetical protein